MDWREDLPRAAVTPHLRQLRHQALEFYGFIHFTVNTFTDREWGDGTESPAVFNPSELDARQWAWALKSAGMRGMILTCKHHDGFCLWPSRWTEHSVKNSPWKNGQGDVVREAAEACLTEGLRFGVYCSPWDRHDPRYGQGKAYDDYFVAQLEELLGNYGEIFSVWFDGACGEGANGKKQHYDWERYYETVRRLQPGACISVCGPDVRWCGNEAGDTREAEWSVVPRRTMDTEKIASRSQQSDDTAFRQRRIRAQDRDLGSREALRGEDDLIWYPAEVNTSIRPGWFWYEAENSRVRSAEELFRIYVRSVGGNATFLLNVPPDRRGLICGEDLAVLRELGERVHVLEQAALPADAVWSGTQGRPGCEAGTGCWMPPDGVTEAELTAQWREPQPASWVVLQEDITRGQRVERFEVELCGPDGWKKAGEGLTVGWKRILPAAEGACTGIRVRIRDSRVAPTLKLVGIC